MWVQDFQHLSDNPQWPIAAVVAAAIFGLLAATVLVTEVRTTERQGIGFEYLGDTLFTDWAVPFEVASLVLLVALVGAIVLVGSGEWPAMIELAHFQVLSAALFAIGIYGVLARRSAVLILMSIELMLNAVSINLVGFAAFVDFSEPQRALGQVIVIFVITIAAAELALAMAIILRLYQNRSSVNVDEIDLMKW